MNTAEQRLKAEWEKQKRWDAQLSGLARVISTWSEDASTKIGCVLLGKANNILATGYNGLPRGIIATEARCACRPAKYTYMEHAERNAIFNAAREGVRLDGATAYITMYPCAECARALIQSGIREVIAPEPNWNDERWGSSFATAHELLCEAGITIRFMPTETA